MPAPTTMPMINDMMSIVRRIGLGCGAVICGPRERRAVHQGRLTSWAGLLVLLLAAVTARAEEIRDGYFHTSDGIRLHYREAGHGDKVIVLVPGWLMPAEIFDGQLRGLGDDYHVYALSPRSQGQSDAYSGRHTPERRARDIKEFIDHLGPGGFVLGGWSLGVMEALDYVERFRPPGLRALVLVDNSIGEATPPRPGLTPRRGVESVAARAERLRAFVRGMFHTPQPPEFLELIDRSVLRVPSDIAQELLAKPYAREYYKNVIYRERVPVLYAITPRLRDQGAALAAHLPGARVTVYPAAGHALFVDAAAEFNADLGRFLAGVY
jgi:microsomal epoxide hydrolase